MKKSLCELEENKKKNNPNGPVAADSDSIKEELELVVFLLWEPENGNSLWIKKSGESPLRN